jgi:hypothetical protein
MKVLFLVLLLCLNTLAFAKTVPKKKNTHAKLVSAETKPSDVKAQWRQQQTDLITRLQQALAFAKKSSDDQLKQRAVTLNGKVTKLIKDIKGAQDGQGYEEKVNRLIEQLKGPERPPPINPPGNDLDTQKDELTKRVNKAVIAAQAAAKETSDSELKLRAGRLEIEATKLQLSIAAMTSAASLAVAKKEIEQLETESNYIVDAASSWGITTGLVVGAFGAFFALVAMLLLTISFFHFRNQLSKAEIRNQENQPWLKQLTIELADLGESVKTIDGNNKVDHNHLSEQIATARRISEEAKQLAIAKRQPDSSENTTAPAVTPINNDPTFPSLVSDYLTRIADSRKRAVEADFRTETFIPSSAESSPFVLVADYADDAGILLPRVRLQRGQDYSSHYKSSYDCVNPFAGEVYITEPARVVRSSNGWRLQEKGKMEIH